MSHMLPFNAFHDHPNAFVIHSKLAGYLRHCVALAFNVVSDFEDLFLGQFPIRVLFSEIGFPTLCERILHVFGTRTWEQVPGIAARRIIASVTAVFIRINASMYQFVSDPVCIYQRTTCPHSSVSVAASTPNPLPAFIWLSNLYLAPKSLTDIYRVVENGFTRLAGQFAGFLIGHTGQ